jgi:hypothetical protein
MGICGLRALRGLILGSRHQAPEAVQPRNRSEHLPIAAGY